MRHLVLCLLLVATPLFAAEPYFAPAVTQGSLTVSLHPTEGVAAGVPTLVTFGLPFPRGSITEAGLATVRVLRNGIEIPAHVSQMTPWRHRSDAAIDGQSVRVAQVQFAYGFLAAFPASESISVSWGGVARSLDVPAAQDPRTAWHAVTSGSFTAVDGVTEPDVYAVLPRSWLTLGLLTTSRTTAFDATNGEARDDPSTNDATLHWPDFQESERAFKNNAYTVLNRDDPLVQDNFSVDPPEININHYRGPHPFPTAYNPREPWLYDRAATLFVLYFRSGTFTALREAVRAAEYYAVHVDAQGFFDVPNFDGTVPPGDTKYSCAESPAYAYWVTGDATMLPVIDRVSIAHDSFQHVWTPQRNFWTERNSAFKLTAKVVAYEVRGGDARRAMVDQMLLDFRVHQDGANGQVPFPVSFVDGGLFHTGEQHDYDFPPASYGGSSWMSALLMDAATRAYGSGEDAATAQFIARLGDFLRATVVVNTDHPCDDPIEQRPLPLAVPRYTMLIDGSTGQNQFEDIEHALDVGSQLAWARWFRESLGGDGDALAQSARDLYASYDTCVNFWIRPTAPAAAGKAAFRVSPPRKWAWEHRISGGFAFALSEPDASRIHLDGFESE